YVSRIEELGARHVHLELKNAGTNPLMELRTVAGVLKCLRRSRPAVLLTFTPKVNIYCSIAARMLGIPVIANVSGLGRGFVEKGWIRTVSRVLYRHALAHSRFVFFQNEEDLAEFVRGKLVDECKAVRLPGSGVDLERFRPRIRTDADSEVRFLFSSRLLWDKGLGEYVEAARRVKAAFGNVRCRLLGFLDVENPSAVPGEEVTRWHGEGVVEYFGATNDVIPHLADVDCVVLPSFYREGVPRSLLEAASMGLPVITTDMPGCRDMVEDGVTGYICKPRSAEDLAEKMQRMAALSRADRLAMGAAGRQKMIREFDERIVLQKYSEALAIILAGLDRDSDAAA
ncbi:MAG: glycosyltransferase family 4 protein, partial [Betaproteobacteria bacterium]